MVKVPLPKKNRSKAGKTKCIVAGGSYPGNLAAWVRAKYPNIVTGAIASLAPVFAKEDFFEYNQQVQQTLAWYSGEACTKYHYNVFAALNAIFQSGNRHLIGQVKADFGCGDVADLAFIDYLSYTLGIVQYNQDNDVKDFCRRLKLNGTIFEKLANFARNFKHKMGSKTCQQFTRLGEALEITPNPNNAMQQWTYQCCTEFGYWQTAPHPPCCAPAQA
ncbi:Thymus-specific serine protease [Entomophthora muscae]|uniref:Thymus-specific serine protease n=1 Tax=Entomophthora muscae TaxID=34485 RepID=A0ACC2UDU9_9FUNG|nr:Thymus-specific serine protease [Entomophthora muscae]